MQVPEPVGEREVLARKYGKQFVAQNFQLPDGNEIDYVSQYGETVPVIVFAVTEDGKVVVVHQYRYAPNVVITELPGGCPKPGQTPEDVLAAELREETGYEYTFAVRITPQSLFFEPASLNTPYLAYLATGCRKIAEPNLDPTEFLTVEEVGLGEWLYRIFGGEIRDDKTIAVTMLALPHLGYKITRSIA